jgi:LPXTG-motif cell wall-anchored protein
MVIWIVILGMALVGGFWVKARRQRKTKATYAGN